MEDQAGIRDLLKEMLKRMELVAGKSQRKDKRKKIQSQKMRNEWGTSDLSKEEFNKHLDDEKEINDLILQAEIRGSIKSEQKERREKLCNLFSRFFEKIEKEKTCKNAHHVDPADTMKTME